MPKAVNIMVDMEIQEEKILQINEQLDGIKIKTWFINDHFVLTKNVPSTTPRMSVSLSLLSKQYAQDVSVAPFPLIHGRITSPWVLVQLGTCKAPALNQPINGRSIRESFGQLRYAVLVLVEPLGLFGRRSDASWSCLPPIRNTKSWWNQSQTPHSFKGLVQKIGAANTGLRKLANILPRRSQKNSSSCPATSSP